MILLAEAPPLEVSSAMVSSLPARRTHPAWDTVLSPLPEGEVEGRRPAGEGLRPHRRVPYPLTRSFAPTSPHGRGEGVEPDSLSRLRESPCVLRDGPSRLLRMLTAGRHITLEKTETTTLNMLRSGRRPRLEARTHRDTVTG
jgi:hypothetical protein